MSAIQTIVETYIRLADEQGLLALRAHRLRLLTTIDENDSFSRNLRSQCIDEISAIDTGLVRLRPAAVPLQDLGAPEAIPSGVDHPSPESLETEPFASQDDIIVPQASDISISDQSAGTVPPPAPNAPTLPPAATGLPDPSLIAGSLLAASLASWEPDGTGAAIELIKLQRRLTRRLKG